MIELHRIEREISPRALVALLEDATPRTTADVQRLILESYEDPLLNAAYSTRHHFEEAVERARHQIRSGRSPGPESAPFPDPESNNPVLPRGRRDLDAIVRTVLEFAERQLPIVRTVLEFAERQLPASRADRLVAPTVRWTRCVERGKFGEWRLGDEEGEHVITVNRVLKTGPDHVPDAWISFIVWHELVHAVTPGQAHDAEFSALETPWPDALACDPAVDAIAQNWSMNPADYRSRDPRCGTGSSPSGAPTTGYPAQTSRRIPTSWPSSRPTSSDGSTELLAARYEDAGCGRLIENVWASATDSCGRPRRPRRAVRHATHAPVPRAPRRLRKRRPPARRMRYGIHGNE